MTTFCPWVVPALSRDPYRVIYRCGDEVVDTFRKTTAGGYGSRPAPGRGKMPMTSSRSPHRGLRGLRVTLHHLVLEHAPDFAMQRMKILFHAYFRNIPRTRQRHAPVTDDARGGSSRHDHNAVGECDRLLEVVGDEQHRLAVGVP